MHVRRLAESPWPVASLVRDQVVEVKHVKITFTDGTVEELDSKYEYVTIVENVLTTRSERVGGYADVGPSFPLFNIRKYEFVEGYK